MLILPNNQSVGDLEMSERNQGIFITVEGTDGAGKTTVLESIRGVLQSQVAAQYAPIFTREPGGTEFGELIRSDVLTHRGMDKPSTVTELLCMLASRNHHLEHLIMPALVVDCMVVCSRFNDSTRVLQGVLGGAGELIQNLSRLDEFKFLRHRPDITFFIDVDDEVAAARLKVQGDDDRLGEKWQQFSRLSQTWRQHIRLAEFHPSVAHGPSKIIRINGDQSKQAVADECLDKLSSAMVCFRERTPMQQSFFEKMCGL
jgi:dTMP kinase